MMWFEERSHLDEYPSVCPKCGSEELYSDGAFFHDDWDYWCDGLKCDDCREEFYVEVKK